MLRQPDWSLSLCQNILFTIIFIRSIRELYFWLREWNPPLHPIRASPPCLLQTWCTWFVSQPLPPSHSALPTECIPPPMRSLRLSQPLLQQPSDWPLFLGMFGRRRRLEYLVLPLFTHTEEQAVTEWMRESQGEHRLLCLASSHPSAFLPLCFHSLLLLLLLPWTSEQFFCFNLFSSYWSKLPLVDCLLTFNFFCSVHQFRSTKSPFP